MKILRSNYIDLSLTSNRLTIFNDYVFFKKTDYKNISNLETDTLTENIKKRKKEPLIICKVCKNIITSPKNIIEVDGSHRHTFSNPEGIVYNIGCFSKIKGYSIIGDPILEHTWFPGFSWQIVICASCFSHIGWRFQSGSSNFFGLVTNNLMENE